jgi:hypothetical protein
MNRINLSNVDKRNVLFEKDYLIPPKLQYAIQNECPDCLELDRKLSKDRLGIYLVMFRLLQNNDDKVLVYNYMYYDSSFKSSLLAYLLSIDLYYNVYYKEGGRFLSIVDTKLAPENLSSNEKLLKNVHNEHLGNILSNISNSEYLASNYFETLSLINRLLYVSDYSTMSLLLKYGIDKNYLEFIRIVLGTIKNYNDLENKLLKDDNPPSFNVINSCLFVVEDQKSFLDIIQNNGYTVSGGPSKWRAQVSSISNFLSNLDLDYRWSLYHHNNYHAKTGNIDWKFKLPRSKFSFNNIHMNLGGVRWYSTRTTNSTNSNINSNIEDKTMRTRQQLLEVNYNMVGDILENNSYIGSKEVQMQIEEALLNQENIFANDNIKKNKIRFNEESFELINNKKLDLCRLMSNSDDIKFNTKFHNVEFQPWYQEILTELGADLIANLLLSYFMEILTKESIKIEEFDTPGISSLTAYNKFGFKIVNKYIYNKYCKSIVKKNNGSLSEFKHDNIETFKDIYTENFYSRVGGFFVWHLVTVNLIYEDLDTHPTDYKKTEYYLRVCNDVRIIMMKNHHKIYHLPQKLPMVSEPKEFIFSNEPKENKLGGYLLNDIHYTDGIFKDKIGYGKCTTLRNNNIIVSLINGLNKTPYKINTDTLNYIYKYGFDKNILIDDTDSELLSFMDNPYKSCSKIESKKFRSTFSKILMQRNILNIAEVYSNVDKIYFPVRLDQRTRIYCITDYLDYQKNDLAKGLILFANPGIITKYDTEVINYFKAYGANMYGSSLDKKSVNYRVKWVDDNSDKILNFETNTIVDNAENKVSFISFCYEYKRFKEFWDNKDQVVFYTYLPTRLDASCNGYQHLVLLTKENKLLNKLNLDKSTHDDDPNDFYTYIFEKIGEYIDTLITELSKIQKSKMNEKEISLYQSYKKLKKVRLDRSIIKKTIMTESYSAGIPLLVKDILSNLIPHYLDDSSDNKNKIEYYTYKTLNVKLTRDDIVLFVKSLKKVVNLESPKINELSKYLNAIVTICTKLSIPVPWVLPSGAEIHESYLVEEEQSIPAFSFVKSRYTFKKYLKEEYDLDKQRRAIRPNLIHSLDATTIAMLYNNMTNKDCFFVHDCFAVTANHVPYLIKKLKLVYLKLYSSNSYLKEFDSFVRETINKSYGDKVFPVNGKSILLPGDNTGRRKPYPDIYKIIKSDNVNKIKNLNESSNIVI